MLKTDRAQTLARGKGPVIILWAIGLSLYLEMTSGEPWHDELKAVLYFSDPVVEPRAASVGGS